MIFNLQFKRYWNLIIYLYIQLQFLKLSNLKILTISIIDYILTDSNIAYTSYLWATLISNAVKLDLDVSDFEEDFNEIEEACVEIEKEINGIQSTSAWYYMYVLKTDEERKVFIEKFLKMTDDLDENLLNEE